MLRWHSLTGKWSLPSYSLLRAVPTRCLPQELVDREASTDYQEWRDRIESDLDAQGCDEDEPNFLTQLKTGSGFLQLLLPQLEGGVFACLLDFNSRCRLREGGCTQTNIHVLLL